MIARIEPPEKLKPLKIYCYKKTGVHHWDSSLSKFPEYRFFYTCGGKKSKWREYRYGNPRQDNTVLSENFLLEVFKGKIGYFEYGFRLRNYDIQIFELDSVDEITSIKMMDELVK